MTIHHATVKSAAAKGIAISHDEEAARFEAVYVDPNSNADSMGKSFTLFAADDADIKDLVACAAYCKMMVVEHTHLFIEGDVDAIGDDEAVLLFWDTTAIGSAPLDLWALEDAIPDALAAAEAGDVDGLVVSEDSDDEEEAASTGNVVPAKYRQQYAAEGHPDNCGDWLALTLEPLVTGELDGKTRFIVDRMLMICDANKIDAHKYCVNQTRGWEGRMRMTARNMLAKRIAAEGVLYLPDGVGGEGDRELTVPAEWAARFAPKPKEAGNKAKKAAPKIDTDMKSEDGEVERTSDIEDTEVEA